MACARVEPSTTLAALVAAACVLAACEPGRRRTPDDTLVVLLEADFAELDPRFFNSAYESKVSGLIAAGLVSLEPDSPAPHLVLAESTTLVDPLTRDFTLRADARFSDGTPVTAADVAYTYLSILDPALKSPLRQGYGERFAAVEALDARRVRFHLRQPVASFSDFVTGIVSRAAALAEGGRFPDGRTLACGPYRIVSFAIGDALLEANPYWAGAPPPVPRIHVRTVKDAGARMLMLAGTSADFTQNSVRVDLTDALAAHPRLHAVSGPSIILTYLMFNNEDPILGDVRVRRAIAHAIDRERLIAARFAGHAVLATGLLAPLHWAYSGDVRRYQYDLPLARALLDDAGWPDPDGPGGQPRFRLTYKTSSDAFRVSVARVLVQQLAEVGIAVELRSFDFAIFIADLRAGNFQLASMQTKEIVDPDLYTYYFHTRRIPSAEHPDHGNRFRYRSARADALIDAGRVAPDRATALASYAELQRLLADDLPIFPLWHEDNIAIMNVDVSGYTVVPGARIGALARTSKSPR